MRCKAVVLALGLFAAASHAAAPIESGSIRVIIKYKNNYSSLSSVTKEIKKSTHLGIKALKPMANGAYSLIFEQPSQAINKEEELNRVLAQLRVNPHLAYAVEDRIGHFKPLPEVSVTPSVHDLLSHESQWDEFAPPAGIMLESKAGLRDGAWAYTTGIGKSTPVVVAVLDTGIALNESLVNNLVKDKNGAIWGWNFAGNNNDLADETESYHGTHVAGTIAGYGNVMLGIGDGLKILPVKIPAENGLFYESNVINSIYWSVGAKVPDVPDNIHPAKVLNMSFGVDLEPGREIDYCDEALQEAIFFARQKGAVLVAAAGNDNRWEHFNAPAVCNGTIKVASTGPEGLRSYFSNYGPSVTLAAPGGDKRYGMAGGILSTVNPGGGYNHSGFDFYQGTSMAAPHVAGVAGLIYAVSTKDLSAEQVEQILYTTTHDFGISSSDNNSCIGKKPCGHGILDAEHAVKAAVNDYDVYFSAPSVLPVLSSECSTGQVKLKIVQPAIMSDLWIRINDACVNLKDNHPKIAQGAHGEIYADFGLVRYQLNPAKYKQCQVVGFDGVACYY